MQKKIMFTYIFYKLNMKDAIQGYEKYIRHDP